MKNEKGITLIALVITVIIMLILAGVAISALTGDGGVFDKTLKSAEAYENAAQKEAKQLDDLMNEIDGYIGDLTADKKAPTVANLVASNITDTTFTLTATGEDDRGIVKYEFYIKETDGNFKLERTMEVSGNTAVYNVTEKTSTETVYEYKVIVYDKAGNSKESDVITVGGKKFSEVAKVGDYINYDAGVWTQEDLDKITSKGNTKLHSTVNDEITGNQELPTNIFEFGGFELGQSRNTNSTPYLTQYAPRTAGWRVWDVNDSTGVVTLISAGHPESYYHASYYSNSLSVLKNRDCTMYENEYAKARSAHILTGQEVTTWYNKQYNTSYSISDLGGKNSSFYGKVFSTEEPISVFEIGAFQWLATAYDNYNLYYVKPNDRFINGSTGHAMGVRILLELNLNVLVHPNVGDGSVDNPWKIAGM